MSLKICLAPILVDYSSNYCNLNNQCVNILSKSILSRKKQSHILELSLGNNKYINDNCIRLLFQSILRKSNKLKHLALNNLSISDVSCQIIYKKQPFTHIYPRDIF